MPETLQWAFNAQLVDGPSSSFSNSLSVEAYDKIDVVIDAETGGTPATKTIEVQPGGEGRVLFLLITASSYDPPLTYDVDTSTGITLDAPLLLVGSGAVGAFANDLTEFTFHNDHTSARTIEILVGRNASA